MPFFVSDLKKNIKTLLHVIDLFDLDLSGNLVNTDTKWNITGSLIKKVDLKESDIFCTVGRTLYIPVRSIFLFGTLLE